MCLYEVNSVCMFFFSWVCVPGNWTHDLHAASTKLCSLMCRGVTRYSAAVDGMGCVIYRRRSGRCCIYSPTEALLSCCRNAEVQLSSILLMYSCMFTQTWTHKIKQSIPHNELSHDCRYKPSVQTLTPLFCRSLNQSQRTDLYNSRACVCCDICTWEKRVQISWDTGPSWSLSLSVWGIILMIML